VLRPATSKTCEKTRSQLIGRLHRIISHVRKLIILDADLSDAVVNFVAGDHPAAPVAGSEEAPSSWPVSWYSQTRPEAIEVALVEAAKKAPFFVTTDSRERAAALHGPLQHHLPKTKGLLITSDTTHKAETQAWIQKLTSHEALKESAAGCRLNTAISGRALASLAPARLMTQRRPKPSPATVDPSPGNMGGFAFSPCRSASE